MSVSVQHLPVNSVIIDYVNYYYIVFLMFFIGKSGKNWCWKWWLLHADLRIMTLGGAEESMSSAWVVIGHSADPK